MVASVRRRHGAERRGASGGMPWFADGDRLALLSRASPAPTHIVHGAEDPADARGRRARPEGQIAGATLEIIEGMGHDLPAPLWPRLAAAIGRP